MPVEQRSFVVVDLVLRWRPYQLGETLAKAIDDMGDVLRGCDDEAERCRFLPAAAVAALRGAGRFRLSAPRAVGGMEADPVLEAEVFEAVARLSSSAGWNLFVGSLHTALPAAYVSDEAAEAMFGGDDWAVVAGQMAPLGIGRRIEGGMRVTGRYSWAAACTTPPVLGGVRMAHGNGGEPTGSRVFVVPRRQVTVLDNWHVLGVAGSGSYDYAVDDVFVPAGCWFDFLSPERRRGGLRYAPPIGPQITSAHCGFALGAGERALDEIASLAGRKQRALASGTVASRGAFQRDLGRAHAMLGAVRDHAARLLGEVHDRRMAGEHTPPSLEAELRAAATLATEAAVDVAHMALRYSGRRAERERHPARAARGARGPEPRHVVDTNNDNLGLALLGEAGAEGLDAVRAGYR